MVSISWAPSSSDGLGARRRPLQWSVWLSIDSAIVELGAYVTKHPDKQVRLLMRRGDTMSAKRWAPALEYKASAAAALKHLRHATKGETNGSKTFRKNSEDLPDVVSEVGSDASTVSSEHLNATARDESLVEDEDGNEELLTSDLGTDPELADKACLQVARALELCTPHDVKLAVQLAERARLPEDEYSEVRCILTALRTLEDAVGAAVTVEKTSVDALVVTSQRLAMAMRAAREVGIVERELAYAEVALARMEKTRTTVKEAKRAALDQQRRRAYWNDLGSAGRNQKSNDLHSAAQDGQLEQVVTLLAAGVMVNWPGSHKKTALHFAAMSGSADVAAALVDAGAEVNVKDQNGKTPADIADLQQEIVLADWLRTKEDAL